MQLPHLKPSWVKIFLYPQTVQAWGGCLMIQILQVTLSRYMRQGTSSRACLKQLHKIVMAYKSHLPSSLSSLLAEATASQIYLDQAIQSFSFIQNLLLNTSTMIPQQGIHLDPFDTKSCSTTPPSNSFCAGTWIEGLAVFNTVANASLKPNDELSSNSYVAAMTTNQWHSADGIISNAAGEADVNLPRSLGMLYQRTEDATLKSDIEKYLAVQYNAILDLSTTNGSNMYAWDWTGPPSSEFDDDGQVTALAVLVPLIALPETHSTPTSPPTFTPSFVTSLSNKTPIGEIVGSVAGGVIALATVIALLLVWRHRRKSQRPGDFEQAQVPHIEPFTQLPHPLATRSGSIVGQGGSPKGQESKKQNPDSAQITQSSLPFLTPFTQNEQQHDHYLLQQMGATLSILNRRLAQVEGTSTVGSETDGPPEYPGSISH
ncbi:hypothetical protein V5O48_003589 [Marasmius crinis-equi]|uniref:Glycoside hydrolase family 76 protein n=1 Tax=Marasmius crinis-equi TaxID=585013 RepID=A0ABR3FSP2_9AGAR